MEGQWQRTRQRQDHKIHVMFGSAMGVSMGQGRRADKWAAGSEERSVSIFTVCSLIISVSGHQQPSPSLFPQSHPLQDGD